MEVIDCILEITGRQRGKVRLPIGLAMLLARTFEVLYGKLLRLTPPLNRDQIRMLQGG